MDGEFDMAKGSDIVIGAFYETPDGRIARTFGWDGRTGRVSYAFDDDSGPHAVAGSELEGTWSRRADLVDFPDARDPMLPHEFDLTWDAKRRSALIGLLADVETEADVRAAMERHGIALDPAEAAKVETARRDAGNDRAMGFSI